jgi:hypothetical protein
MLDQGQRSPPERRRKNSGSSSSGDDRVVAPKPAKPRRIPTREKLGVSDKDSDDNKASSPRFVTSFLGASPKVRLGYVHFMFFSNTNARKNQ